MKIHEYNEMMAYLTRPAVPDPSSTNPGTRTADLFNQGGRVGFFKGSDPTKATDFPGIFTREHKTGKKVYFVDMKRGSKMLRGTFDSLEDAQDAYKKFDKKNLRKDVCSCRFLGRDNGKNFEMIPSEPYCISEVAGGAYHAVSLSFKLSKGKLSMYSNFYNEDGDMLFGYPEGSHFLKM